MRHCMRLRLREFYNGSTAGFALGGSPEHYSRIGCEPWSLLRMSRQRNAWKLCL